MGIPSCAMVSLEWWCFEVMTFMSAYISVDATAVQAIACNTCILSFMGALGVQTAASTLIGNQIGARNIPTARRYFRVIAYYNLF